MKIVLIGFMASGKSSVAKALAGKLSYPVVEIDDLILENSGYTSVRELFAAKGEAAFREIERQEIAKLSDSRNVIISPGGGAILDNENQKNLRAAGGSVVYLKASFDTVLNRAACGGGDRPLLSNVEAARQIYESRLDTYSSQADHVIDTDGKSIEKVTDEVFSVLTRGVSE